MLVSLRIAEARDLQHVQPTSQYAQPDLQQVQAYLHASANKWLDDHAHVTSESLLLNAVMHRSLLDLRALRSTIADREFFAAGVPWFVTLFGRDSLIATLQTLAYDPDMAKEILRLLASYQGQRVDAYRDKQPGKILHELRIGEMANIGEIPHSPYYGTVDATLLFLILLGRHAAWTGDLTVFHDLRQNVEQALTWMSEYGDLNGDGYIEYRSTSEHRLINQGWKDSGDALVNADGSLAKPPIALVEVQGYAYLAKLTIAGLYRRAGEPERADRLEREAEALRTRFNRDFWLEDKGIYALALQAENTPCAVVSSNPGHALWSGVADPDKAQRTAERLMAEDMFTGWGIRTLSDEERRYNPIGYHLGTVWPHDNAIIAMGFRRYGYDDAFGRVFMGIVEAAMHFSAYRLPELFAGFRREDYGMPVRYPVACHPLGIPCPLAAGDQPQGVFSLTARGLEHRLAVGGSGQGGWRQVGQGRHPHRILLAPLLCGRADHPLQHGPTAAMRSSHSRDRSPGARGGLPRPEGRAPLRSPPAVAALGDPMRVPTEPPSEPCGRATAPVWRRLRPSQGRSRPAACAPMGIGGTSTSTHKRCASNRGRGGRP